MSENQTCVSCAYAQWDGPEVRGKREVHCRATAYMGLLPACIACSVFPVQIIDNLAFLHISADSYIPMVKCNAYAGRFTCPSQD